LGEQLSQDEGENSAVAVILHFNGGINPAEDLYILMRAIFTADSQGNFLLRPELSVRPMMSKVSLPSQPRLCALIPSLNWSGRMPMPTRFER
jgi:hypothetical protein